jgi:hypothetical protein
MGHSVRYVALDFLVGYVSVLSCDFEDPSEGRIPRIGTRAMGQEEQLEILASYAIASAESDGMKPSIPDVAIDRVLSDLQVVRYLLRREYFSVANAFHALRPFSCLILILVASS